MSILLCYEQKRSMHYIYISLYMLSWFFRMKLYFLRQRRGSSIIRSHWSVSFLFLFFSHRHTYACILTYTYLYTHSTHLKILLELGRTANQFSFLASIHSFSLSYFHLPLTLIERVSNFFILMMSLEKIKICIFASFSFLFFFQRKNCLRT